MVKKIKSANDYFGMLVFIVTEYILNRDGVTFVDVCPKQTCFLTSGE